MQWIRDENLKKTKSIENRPLFVMAGQFDVDKKDFCCWEVGTIEERTDQKLQQQQ